MSSTQHVSIKDKVLGEVDRLVGKVQHNPEKVAEGTARKGHADKAEAVLSTGDTDASAAAKQHAAHQHELSSNAPSSAHHAAAGASSHGSSANPSWDTAVPPAHGGSIAGTGVRDHHSQQHGSERENTHSHVPKPHDEHTQKVGAGAKLSGEMDKIKGKSANNPELVAEGLERKGHPEKAEAVLRTGNTDASEAGKEVGVN